MTNAPERIWVEDEFGDGDEDQWTYGTWDVRNYRGYVVEYVRADIVPHVNETPKSEHDERVMLTLTAERDRLREALRHIVTYLAEPTVASEDTLNSLRGDLRFVGRVASAALKGETL